MAVLFLCLSKSVSAVYEFFSGDIFDFFLKAIFYVCWFQKHICICLYVNKKILVGDSFKALAECPAETASFFYVLPQLWWKIKNISFPVSDPMTPIKKRLLCRTLMRTAGRQTKRPPSYNRPHTAQYNNPTNQYRYQTNQGIHGNHHHNCRQIYHLLLIRTT